jgi:hypothetical protein
MRGSLTFGYTIPLALVVAMLHAEQAVDRSRQIQRIPLEDVSNRPRPQILASQSVFSKTDLSVFRATVHDTKGASVKQGVAFSIGPRTLVTTLAPVSGGSIVVDTIRELLPVKIERADTRNGVTLLTTASDLPGEPLHVSAENPLPGQPVFAVGNLTGSRVLQSGFVLSTSQPPGGRALMTVSSRSPVGDWDGPLIDSKGNIAGLIVSTPAGNQKTRYALPATSLVNIAATPAKP